MARAALRFVALLAFLPVAAGSEQLGNCSSLPQKANPTCYDEDQDCVCLCESPVVGPCALCDECDCCTPDVPIPTMPTADLAAWHKVYDALAGSDWETCSDAKDDPCVKCPGYVGCSTSTGKIVSINLDGIGALLPTQFDRLECVLWRIV